MLLASLRYLSAKGRVRLRHQLLLPSLPASLERLSLDCWASAGRIRWRPECHCGLLHSRRCTSVLYVIHCGPTCALFAAVPVLRQLRLSPPRRCAALLRLRCSLVELHFCVGLRSFPRRLTLGEQFGRPLQAESLPGGLRFLCFSPGHGRMVAASTAARSAAVHAAGRRFHQPLPAA